MGAYEVSALCNMHTLYTNDCEYVPNIKSLGNLHFLDSTGCSGITDVSSLGNLHVNIEEV